MKPIIIITVLLLFASIFSMPALAGNQLSPKLKVIALQMEDGIDVLQLIVRKNIGADSHTFSFNPADCDSTVIIEIKSNGKLERHTQYFSIPLSTDDHSSAERRQLLNESFTALITSRSVVLYVRDDVCTDEGSRVVSGVHLQG